MKARTDFVSNSSSSSFVLAVKPNYKLKDFCKDLAASTIKLTAKYHDKNLKESNFTKLLFCLSSYQLAWLGRLSIGKHRVVESKKKLLTIFDGEAKEYIEAEWESRVKVAKQAKSSHAKVDKWTLEKYKDAEVDEVHDEIRYTVDITVEAPAVLNSAMKDMFLCSPRNAKESCTEQAAKIVEFAKKRWTSNCFDNVDMFQITKETIQNTKSLIDAGYSVDLSSLPVRKSIEQLESMLDRGTKICCVRIAHSGDGYGDTYIYCEDRADGIYGISGIEILGGESL